MKQSPCCKGRATKYGFSKKGKQRFRCRTCGKCFIKNYEERTLSAAELDNQIVCLVKEGCGIRSTARILQRSPATIIRKIRVIAACVKSPQIMPYMNYEMDELCTFIGNKTEQTWIIYAIRRDTRTVVSFTVGSRSNTSLGKVTSRLLASSATLICTDRLLQYKSLIPADIHCNKRSVQITLSVRT